MKNKSSKIFVAIFTLMLVVPGLLFFVWAGNDTLTQTNEQRELAELPIIEEDTEIADVVAGFEDYYTDRIPFRSQMLQFNAYVNYELFNRSTVPRVVIGKHDWLFFNDPDDGDTMYNAVAGTYFTDDELIRMTTNVLKLQEIATANGATLTLHIAPNKELVYQEYFPDQYTVVNETQRVEQLIAHLEQHTDINIVYSKDVLLEQKENHEVFYKTDTHWNYIGAYYSSVELLQSIGLSLEPADITVVDGTDRVGDLAIMAMIQDYIPPDNDYKIEGYMDNITVTGDPLVYSLEVRAESTINNGRSLLMLHDSFNSAMLPYTTKNFDKSVFKLYSYAFFGENETAYSFSNDVITEQPTDIIFSLAERNLPMLQWFEII